MASSWLHYLILWWSLKIQLTILVRTSSKPSLGAADPLDSGHGHAVQGDEGREAGVGGYVPPGSLLATAFKVDLMYVI